jgi:hypothetical protein
MAACDPARTSADRAIFTGLGFSIGFFEKPDND